MMNISDMLNMTSKSNYRILFIFTILIPLFFSAVSHAGIYSASGKKVLVVMSYHEGYSGEEEIKKGIETVLLNEEIRYFWMDTKRNKAGGEAKAAEAFELYNKFMPDAVIAADDNAQSLFVVPYLKDKVKTPVIFCGVNNEATKYGYPASNVTGIIEKKHYRESISFAQLLAPNIKKLGIIMNDTYSNRQNYAQISKEQPSFSAEIAVAITVKTAAELKSALKDMLSKADALLTMNLSGILDEYGEPMEGADAIRILQQHWNKPTITDTAWQLKAGYLCGVIKLQEEQGRIAAEMTAALLHGTPIKKLPVTYNKNGLRMINITTANKLGLTLPPEAVMGTEIILSEPVEKKVLVVMSYHQGNQWQDNQREGIEYILGNAKIKYFYLDTKRNLDGGVAKAKEAYALYKKFRPDAVIAADDNAQSLFVLPYLKNKVDTPVVFSGVNNDASRYGYPASNVTGVVEIKHISESISFARIINKDIRRIAVLYKDNPSNQLNVAQIQKDKAGYSAAITELIKISTLYEAVLAIRSHSKHVDAFLALNLTGILSSDGMPLETTEVYPILTHETDKAIITPDSYDIAAGALCGVVKTGQEQGAIAARMVIDILKGKSIKDIPVIQNSNGQRHINVKTAERLGIDIPLEALRGTTLVR